MIGRDYAMNPVGSDMDAKFKKLDRATRKKCNLCSGGVRREIHTIAGHCHLNQPGFPVACRAEKLWEDAPPGSYGVDESREHATIPVGDR